MASKITKAWWSWQPRRTRKLLVIRTQQLTATHMELFELKDKCKHLEAELARLERLSNG